MRIFSGGVKRCQNYGTTRSSSTNRKPADRAITNAWILSSWIWKTIKYGSIKHIIIATLGRVIKLSFITNGIRSRIKTRWRRNWLNVKFLRLIWTKPAIDKSPIFISEKRRIGSISRYCSKCLSCSRWCKGSNPRQHEKNIKKICLKKETSYFIKKSKQSKIKIWKKISEKTFKKVTK